MSALVVVVLATLCGCVVGLELARRATGSVSADSRGQIARWVVIVLAGAAGALIAAELYALAHQLQLNAGLGHLTRDLDVLAFASAFRGVLFYGGVLIGLAAIVGLIATRKRAKTTV